MISGEIKPSQHTSTLMVYSRSRAGLISEEQTHEKVVTNKQGQK